MGVTIGGGGATVTGPRVDSQTGSIFAATRSVVFAGDRIVLAVDGWECETSTARNDRNRSISFCPSMPETGEVKDSREFCRLRRARDLCDE